MVQVSVQLTDVPGSTKPDGVHTMALTMLAFGARVLVIVAVAVPPALILAGLVAMPLGSVVLLQV